MIEVTASCDIDAPAEAVWSVLTDLDKFYIWNAFGRRLLAREARRGFDAMNRALAARAFDEGVS